MRLSVITDEISQDLGHALDVMAEYGIQDAELRNVYDRYIVDADESLLARVESDLKSRGMRVPCIDTPLFKCELEEKPSDATTTGPTHGAKERTLGDQMTLLQHSIDLCKRFDSPYIRIFSFWKRGNLTPDIEDRIADLLVRPCEVAERAGVTLLLENEHACYLGTGAETARVVERVGSPALKMVWDPGNAFMAGERPYPSGYEAVAPHLAHVHIKDARVTEEGKLYWTVVGEGEIDYAGHFLALARDGYAGVLALETHYRTPEGDAEKASRQCLDGMKRLIADATTRAANA
ncbi:MAG TPA: sugar phosphate isomerase/epimerase [Armatimonadaceae bacterium]|nr:sugar phosphate isomerase/epimerase [Armatimonadaceae bacterium]